MDIFMVMFDFQHPGISPEILTLISTIDEFKGAWRAFGTISPERLDALKRVATIESIGSSTRIEGSKLSDREVEKLMAGLSNTSFESRDEQEVARQTTGRYAGDGDQGEPRPVRQGRQSHAGAPRSEEAIPSPFKILLSEIPVLLLIHSSFVSTIFSRSALVSLSGGTYPPTAVIAAVTFFVIKFFIALRAKVKGMLELGIRNSEFGANY